MTEPKVSERMEALLLEVVMDARTHERKGTMDTLAASDKSSAALLSAIAEIEQRAEKWKELALALWAQAEACRNGYDECRERDDRSDAAIAALGDEWEKAVR